MARRFPCTVTSCLGKGRRITPYPEICNHRDAFPPVPADPDCTMICKCCKVDIVLCSPAFISGLRRSHTTASRKATDKHHHHHHLRRRRRRKDKFEEHINYKPTGRKCHRTSSSRSLKPSSLWKVNASFPRYAFLEQALKKKNVANLAMVGSANDRWPSEGPFCWTAHRFGQIA
ncbi:hypothetical protein ZHAS_00019733 [Anopheles sinensis]|uniref:Uncharacterized protein n=1 Tax=Anopheles sinensis TaxID=74873 RepID=A0A084WN58_ANOSI|nr:hypothetical protein ZHAS_00019733 [Anopheles sinensis]